jgi:hypothetical protein
MKRFKKNETQEVFYNTIISQILFKLVMRSRSRITLLLQLPEPALFRDAAPASKLKFNIDSF